MSEARAALNEAVGGIVEDGEIAVGWILTVEVAGQDGTRYLAHRAGGGHDGSSVPTVWASIGMAESFLDDARRQLHTVEVDDEDDEPET